VFRQNAARGVVTLKIGFKCGEITAWTMIAGYQSLSFSKLALVA
jgi:hypothetical protein